MLRKSHLLLSWITVAIVLALSTGCTGLQDYVHNGFKVGPNYCTPPAPVATQWIDVGNKHVASERPDLTHWWTVFNDPVLNCLVREGANQNITLRQAYYQVAAAQAQLGVTIGGLFPQTQQATGAYTRSAPPGGVYSSLWRYGFNLNWELDFWGAIRRAIEAQQATVDASIEGYDFAVVTMVGNIASSYIQLRTYEEQIQLVKDNVKLQKEVYDVTRAKLAAGLTKTTAVNSAQAESLLYQTEAQIPPLEVNRRTSNNQLCLLLGIPPVELRETIPVWKAEDARKKRRWTRPKNVSTNCCQDSTHRIRVNCRNSGKWQELWGPPISRTSPNRSSSVSLPTCSVAVPTCGRPNVRLPPRPSKSASPRPSTIPSSRLTARWVGKSPRLSQIASSNAFTGSIGPSFTWNVLNYGRLVNGVRLQDATFKQLVATYQQTVLQASVDVENGIATFLQQDLVEETYRSVLASQRALVVVRQQYEVGQAGFDFNQYALIAQNLVTQQLAWAQARGTVAQGLIQVYKGLGGGWEIRLNPENTPLVAPPVAAGPEVAEPAPPAPSPLMPPVPRPFRRGSRTPARKAVVGIEGRYKNHLCNSHARVARPEERKAWFVAVPRPSFLRACHPD